MRVPILTYHSIDDSGSVISTAPRIFRNQMRFLSDTGYRAIPVRELVATIQAKGPLPEKTVVLTFDDGFRNFYTEAFPVLAEFGFRATVFVVTDFCGGHNDWPGNPAELPRSELLSWEEIKELDEAGFEFGSHTRTHADLVKLSQEQVADELAGSRSAIQHQLGRDVTSFAFPFGRSNQLVRRRAMHEYTAACSTDLGMVDSLSDLSSLKRVDAYYLGNRRIFERFSSGAFVNYLRVRQSMRSVRSLLTRT